MRHPRAGGDPNAKEKTYQSITIPNQVENDEADYGLYSYRLVSHRLKNEYRINFIANYLK